MRVLALVGILLAVFVAVAQTPVTVHAGVTEIVIAQTCKDGKVDIAVQWNGANPAATEISVDMSVNADMADAEGRPGTPGRASGSYVWTGAEPNRVVYFRVNQKVAAGWDPGITRRVLVACGTAPAGTGVKMTDVAFAGTAGPNGSRPNTAVAPGGTITNCAEQRIYVFFQVAGVDTHTSFEATLTGPSGSRSYAVAMDEAFSTAAYTLVPAGGLRSGSYTFKFTSGRGDALKTHIDEKVNAAC